MIMSMKTGMALIAALAVAGCSGGAERPAGDDAATAALQTRDTTGTPGSAGMAGMDHGNMAGMDHGGMSGMQGDSQAVGGAGMAGMDHAGMPGMSGPDAQAGAGAVDHSSMPGMRAGDASAGTAEMDHSGMAGHAATPEARGGASTVDHSRMAGMQGMDHSPVQPSPSDPSRASASAAGGMAEMDHGDMTMSGQTRTMPGMDHASIPGMRASAPTEVTSDAGMEKLRALVTELVQDPRVQAQIQADTALRRRWADEGVRRVLLNRP